jgi:NADPH:quinone reductase-like Zn-dependent oxidoreductase
MMRALVHDRYGPPETVMRLEEVPLPQPKPGEVLVRMHAASLNSWDWDLLAGTPMGRIMGPFKPPFRTLGADIAGTVEALGQGVTAFSIGDKVFGDLSDGKWGGLADVVVAPVAALALMPTGLSFENAAALPQAGSLALQAIRKRPDLGPSDTVLINGAGGGVGTIAIHLAKRSGARVVAVDRGDKRDALMALGADEFVDYRTTDYTASADRYALIIDMVAGRPASHYARCLQPGGQFVAIGGTYRGLIGIALSGLIRRKCKLGVLVYKASPADSLALAGLVRPVIDGIYPLALGATAFRRLGDGGHVGKIIITP